MTGLLHEKEFSRKSFVKGGGALIVGFCARGRRRSPARRGATAPISGGLPARHQPGRLLDHDSAPTTRRCSRRARSRPGNGITTGFLQVAGRRARHGHVADALRPLQRRTPDRRRHLHGDQLGRRGRLERDVGHRPEDPQRRRARARRRCSRMASTKLGVPVASLIGRQGRRLRRRPVDHLRRR